MAEGSNVLMREQDVMSGVTKLLHVREMLVDEWKTSANEQNVGACNSIASIGIKLDEALDCMGVSELRGSRLWDERS